jgi:hypothetical protein
MPHACTSPPSSHPANEQVYRIAQEEVVGSSVVKSDIAADIARETSED